MLKLSLIMGLFFGFLAFAKADDSVHKLDFALSLCKVGKAERYAACAEAAKSKTKLSHSHIATDLCPGAGGNDGKLVLRCFNKANEKLKLPIKYCTEHGSYRERIACVNAVFHKADNRSLATDIKHAIASPAGRRSNVRQDDSPRGVGGKVGVGTGTYTPPRSSNVSGN